MKGDTVVHDKNGSHGKVIKVNPNGTLKVKWAFSKSTSDIDQKEVKKIQGKNIK